MPSPSTKKDPYLPSKIYLYSSLFWLALGMIYGLILSLKFLWPNFLAFGPFQVFFQYGRIRPVHTNLVLFGWLTMANIGALFYVIPKLCRNQLSFEKIAAGTGIVWNIIVLAGTVALTMGFTTTTEYAEWPLWIDVLVILGMAAVALVCFATIATRKEKQLYVSLWYFMGSLIWLIGLYIIGNLPYKLLSGVPQFLIFWFYGHNVIGLWFTTVGVGLIYYLLPYLTRNPLYSHKLSLIGFWTIATFYVWNGPHHLQNGPIPLWLMKAGVIPSVLLIIPVWSVLANVFGTLKGKWHALSRNTPLKFLIVGAVFYLVTCLQGPFHSLQGPSSVIKFTDWVPGHAHLPLFGAFSFVAFSFMYVFLPKMLKTKLYSNKLMEWHFYLAVTGMFLFAFSTWSAGVLEGFAWIEGAQYGMQFVEMLISMRPFFAIRAVAGVAMLISSFVFIYNLAMTIIKANRNSQNEEISAG
ncbi:cbb3-type cytochrome c oxidase subunit I [Salipaludibacillus aurantiacus]|uniref:Cytochrome c oxidase cbb3-type subunit 1/cytochrome c oxidase cbb3-type subunit I/II n=1 Tax=Salipaludibacillus aurantiacus TaxID=1601833 RepID=A0A1H9T0L3_9BACI|nr:cbb3-type cytochrome c oxidase subunit I [Salipaludibacillus aurantiacus]SER90765.1 cytochrome c oxidase cbb3-type subunit 1/cytochrome c oxidase cbb3-type subunit I/II [Salipaludibacillus aurantiacus]